MRSTKNADLISGCAHMVSNEEANQAIFGMLIGSPPQGQSGFINWPQDLTQENSLLDTPVDLDRWKSFPFKKVSS